jgi:hypothetical protein
MKTRPDALGTAEYESTGPNALGTAEIECGRAKHENETTPSVPSKTSPGEQNMKTGPDALGTAENESGSAKLDNGTRRPRYHRK